MVGLVGVTIVKEEWNMERTQQYVRDRIALMQKMMAQDRCSKAGQRFLARELEVRFFEPELEG